VENKKASNATKVSKMCDLCMDLIMLMPTLNDGGVGCSPE
jgi:hypothetical protein